MNTKGKKAKTKKLRPHATVGYIKRIKSLCRKVAKHCHDPKCGRKYLDVDDCPQSCSCGGNRLDLHTALIWRAAKSLEIVEYELESHGWWIKELNDSPYRYEDHYFDDFKSEQRVTKEERNNINNYIYVIKMHKRKYPKETDLLYQMQCLVTEIHNNMCNWCYRNKIHIKANLKLWERKPHGK